MKPFALLFEIGVEELPSAFVDAALGALPDLIRHKLATLRITHGLVHALGTPRRLAVLVHELAPSQADVDEEVVGPPESAAYKDGKPTKAAEAFAQKLGVAVSALVVKEVSSGKKPGRYATGRRVEKGKASLELLGAALTEICGAIPFRKSMRWGSSDVAFGRPVQWLVALADEAVIDVSFAGIRSGRESRGHRFLAPGPVVIGSALSYQATLRAAHVVADRKEREDLMMERVRAAAKQVGGEPDPDPMLVSENASLVEEPHVVIGSFDESFLSLPPEVIRSVARGHQKYFCLSRGDVLLPKYLAVANTANNAANVARGNDGVMRARLADARFFFDEDTKQKQEARVEKLAGIVFHNRLGTIKEKVARMAKLGEHIARTLGVPEGEVRRATELCKNDLVSLMVGEFPELQGVMGRAYAKHAGEADIVCDAIRDHYAPVGADGAIAPTDVARVVALADRIDTLVGCFAIGLQPTGTADPYALRRATIGVLRTILEANYAALDLLAVYAKAYEGFEGKKLDASAPDTVAKLADFSTERLRGLLEQRTSRAAADAVLTGPTLVAHPTYALAKARALDVLLTEKAPWLDKARTVAKRLSGISKEAKSELVGKESLSKPTDQAIVDLVVSLDEKTRSLTDEASVREALFAMGTLAEQLDQIFVETLVNDPQDASTPKRLSLLAYGAGCMMRIGDFSRLGS